MAFAIQYPTNGGQGASSSDRLVTACGTFDEFPEGGPYHIYGKLYSAASPPTDLQPPPGRSEGTCILGGATPTWHFNGCSPPLASCIVSSSYVLRVWLSSEQVANHFLHCDAEFTACDASDASCSVDCPDTGGMAMSQMRAAEPVIASSAARYFDVVPTEDVTNLLQFFGAQPSDLSKLKVRLAFDEARSSFDRAVWSASPTPGEQLRLEVTNGSCCARAMLARVRVGTDSIEMLERWTCEYFDVIAGGNLYGVSADGVRCEGSICVTPAAKAAARSVPRASKKAAKVGRAGTRRKGRGR